jgi:ABC-type uncharacterized transport system involved in gliding motility auxiliary subunit
MMKNRRHRLWITLNTGAALLLALVVTLMVNYLSFRHYYREDLSRTQLYKLSSKTIGLLESLDKPIDVTLSFQTENVLYDDVANLLREYQFHSPRLNIHRVDPDRELAKTEELKSKYADLEPNVVIFDCEGRTKYVRENDIATIDASSGIERIVSFKGEQAFSSAIQGVVQKTVPVVYFLTGHGERDITDFDRRTGFSRAGQLVERDNIAVKPLLLSTEKQIPADCSALIVAGASQSMSQAEADLIAVWLRRSGRLMVLTDAGQTSGLEKLLQEWGVLLRNDVVYDPDFSLQGQDIYVAAYGKHPITEKLSNIAAVLYRPRSVEPDYTQLKATAADRPRVTPLALSSKKSWSETQLDQMPPKYDVGTNDRPGPISLAVAVEKGDTSGLLDIQIRPARLVVFGDSDFISNSAITGANQSLFMSALSWLLDREQLMAVAPKEIDDTRLKLTSEKVRTLFWSTIGVIPALAALFGTALWFRRRK